MRLTKPGVRLTAAVMLGLGIGLGGCQTTGPDSTQGATQDATQGATTDATAASASIPIPDATFTAPERLPALSEPLGLLRPDAKADGSAASDNITIIFKPYTVTGTDPKSLSKSLIDAAESEGLSHIARVDWNVAWRFQLDKKDELCRVKSANAKLRVTYRLPEWVPDGTPEPGLVTYWDQFETALWTHEYGHALIGYQVRDDILTLLNDPSQMDPSCSQLRQRLNRTAKAITQRGTDAAYDRDTGHGRTQGALFHHKDAQAAVDAAKKSKLESESDQKVTETIL
jgi:predicted secreted Zn-dependent protease